LKKGGQKSSDTRTGLEGERNPFSLFEDLWRGGGKKESARYHPGRQKEKRGVAFREWEKRRGPEGKKTRVRKAMAGLEYNGRGIGVLHKRKGKERAGAISRKAESGLPKKDDIPES